MGLYDDDYSNGALSPLFNQEQGALSDPRAQAPFSQSALYPQVGALYAQAPQPQPSRGFWGLFGDVVRSRMQHAINQAEMEQLDLQTQRQMLSGAPGGMNLNTPEGLEAAANRIMLRNKAGAASLIEAAQRLRTQQEQRATVDSFRSSPGSLGAGVTPNSPQGQALLSNLTGDPSFDQSVLAAQNEALNSNARLPPQPVTAPRPGLLGPLFNSPYVGASAQSLQSIIDSSRGISPQTLLTQANNLTSLHQTSANQAAGRAENAELRREIASQSDATRRDIASMNAALRQSGQDTSRENRTFTQERQLSENYNALSKDFRKVVPQYQAAEKYMTSRTYNSAGDRAMVFQFAKVLDPQDRVGVNDVRDIAKLGNVPERIVQAAIGLAEGKMLPDRVRQEMFDVINSRFESMNETQMQIEDEYQERARRYMLNPQNVVLPYARRGTTAAPGGANGGWSIKKK